MCSVFSRTAFARGSLHRRPMTWGFIAAIGGIIFLLASCATTAPLTLQDLPSKYEPMSADHLKKLKLQAGGKLFDSDSRVEQSAGFVRVKPFSMIVCATIILSDPLEAAGWDKISNSPEELTAVFAREEISNLSTASTGDQLGNAPGVHFSWTQKASNIEFDAEAVLFRRDKVAFLIFDMRWHGEESPDLVEIAKKMDARRISAQ